MWPGFSFYNYHFFSAHKINFLPCKGLDTGGSNFKSVYAHTPSEKIIKVQVTLYDVYQQKEKNEAYPNYHKDCIEIIDSSWLHIIAASNWIDIGKKNEVVYAMLDKYLEN